MNHTNIVKLEEVIFKDNELNLILEYVDSDLYKFINDHKTGIETSIVKVEFNH